MSLLIRKLAYSLLTLSSFAGVGSLSHAPKLMTNLTKPSVLEVSTDAPPAQKVKEKLEEKSKEIENSQNEIVVAAKVEKEAKKILERKIEKITKKEKDYFTAQNKGLQNNENIAKLQKELELEQKRKAQAEQSVKDAAYKLQNQQQLFISVSEQFNLFEQYAQKLLELPKNGKKVKNIIDQINLQNISDENKAWLKEIQKQIVSLKTITEEDKKKQKEKIGEIKKKIGQLKKLAEDEFKKYKKEKDQAEKLLKHANEQVAQRERRIAEHIVSLDKQNTWKSEILNSLTNNQAKTASTEQLLQEAQTVYSQKNEALKTKLIKKSNDLETIFEFESYYD